MKAKKTIAAALFSVLVTVVALVSWRHRNNIFIHGCEWDTQLEVVGVLPLKPEHMATLAALIQDAPKDPAARRQLFETVRTYYGAFGIAAERSKPGFFSARCPNGPAFAYHLDKAGWLFYAFTEVRDTATVTISESTGIDLLRE